LFQVPTTQQEWLQVAHNFMAKRQMPNTIGALDGKHIHIRRPKNTGTEFYNFKKSYSIVLLALADVDAKFTYIDVGANGKAADGGIWRDCSFKECLESGTLQIPPAKPLPGRQQRVPFIILSDAAFPLSKHILKPYGGMELGEKERIFDYRMSRARVQAECAFGIAAARFRVLLTAMALEPNEAELVVKAICALHNFLISRKHSRPNYCPRSLIDHEVADGTRIPGLWRSDTAAANVGGFSDLDPQTNDIQPFSQSGIVIRNEFADYFVTSEGSIPWQNRMI
jgi:hypothetical protein